MREEHRLCKPFLNTFASALFMNPSQTFEKVKKIFTDYLEQHELRKTSERYVILEEIYSRNDHFDADQLYATLIKKKYSVSRATVYNTLELLLSCDLVKKHQFGNNFSLYEKSFGYRQHDHVICKSCGKVMEFCDPRIQQISSKMGELLNFKIDNHSLILYGLCTNCQQKEKNKPGKTSVKS